jgi:hypothetical protein
MFYSLIRRDYTLKIAENKKIKKIKTTFTLAFWSKSCLFFFQSEFELERGEKFVWKH